MPHTRNTVQRLALLLAPLLVIGFDARADAATKSRHGKARPIPAAATVSPCNDFYAVANGAWLKEHPAPAAGSVSAFDTMVSNARQQERALLEDFARNPSGDAERALGTLWADGMNEAAVDAAGATPLQPLFDRIAKIRKSRDVPAAVADLHAAGVPVLFNFSADVDLKDFDRQLGYANQGGLGLPDRDYYTRTDPDTRALLGRYRTYIETILQLSGTPADKVSVESGWVLSIEMQLAQASLSLLQLRDPNNAYRPVSLAELKKAYPNLAFDKFLLAQHADDDHISLAHSDFFRMADSLLGSVPVEQWRAYLRFHAANALAPYLSRGFQDAHFQLYERVLAGARQPRERAQIVLDAVDRALGEPMGHAYAQRYLPQAAKDAAMRVADGVRAALKAAVEHNAWMDGPTRAAALAKFDKLRIEIGEPSHNSPVSGLAIGNGFGADMLAIAAWRHRHDMAEIGKRTSTRRWPVLAQVPDVSYDLVQNRVVVTAAFLQPPVFDPGADDAQHFGALGALIGHQLQYAFDSKGRTIDADGQLRDWWTPTTSAAYEQRTAPIIAQYDQYPAQGEVKVNGRQTRDENLADLAGVELAMDAFESTHMDAQEVPRAQAAHGRAGTTAQSSPKSAAPSPDQRFFAAYATVWERNSAADTATAAASTSVQAPAKYRVNGVFANVPEFGKAYACKPGQPMRLEAPVSVWR